jgi:hypothetical protein
MRAFVKFTCLEGTAMVYQDRTKEGDTLTAGNSVEVPVADFPEMEKSDSKAFAKAVAHAKTAPGIGGKSGMVRATAVNAPLTVVEYLETDAFLEPDKEDKRRHHLNIGQSVTADLHEANVLTLIVEDVG